MLEGKRTLVSVLLGVGLLLGLISMVLPWWTIEAGGVSNDVKPFDTGTIQEFSGEFVSTMGVVSVGVLALVGILAAAGGGALWLSASNKGESAPPAWWLIIAGGILFVMGPIVAAATWPTGRLGFWDAITNQIVATASVGWFMALLAGALMATAGLVGLQPPMEQEERGDVVDDPPEPEDVGAVAEQTEEVQPPGVA